MCVPVITSSLVSSIVYTINTLLKHHACGSLVIFGECDLDQDDIVQICAFPCVDAARLLDTLAVIGGVQAIVARVDDLKQNDLRAWKILRDATNTRRGRPFALHPFPTAAEVASKYGVHPDTLCRTKKLIILQIANAIARSVKDLSRTCPGLPCV